MKKANKFYLSIDWKLKRDEILKRDNYECQWCKKKGAVKVRSAEVLEVDHIKELSTHPELALDNNNLRTLCKTCHNERHGRYQISENQKRFGADERWD